MLRITIFRALVSGCTGPLDIDKGILLDVENLPTLNYFPLKDTVEQAFPLRVILDNDANALDLCRGIMGSRSECRFSPEFHFRNEDRMCLD